jgi:hypothetical protein
MSDEDDQDYTSVSGMADRLGLKGSRRTKYIHEHMTGLGYRMQPNYVPGGNDDDDEDDDGLMPSARRRRRRDGDDDDDSGNRPRQSRRRSHGDDWYGS